MYELRNIFFKHIDVIFKKIIFTFHTPRVFDKIYDNKF
jgi:hypothetical protein